MKIHRSLGLASAILGATLALTACGSPVTPAPPKIKPLSSADAEEIYANEADTAWADVTAQFPDATRPSVTRIRPMTEGERPEAIAQCLRDAGYDARATADGGVATGGVPTEQQPSLAVASYTCGVQYPFHAELNRPLDDDQIRWLYSYYVGDLRTCLEAEGYTVTSAPSEATFLESYQGRGGEVWTPYNDLASVGSAELQSLAAKCPPVPPGLYPDM